MRLFFLPAVALVIINPSTVEPLEIVLTRDAKAGIKSPSVEKRGEK
jgi:hypothetical protein